MPLKDDGTTLDSFPQQPDEFGLGSLATHAEVEVEKAPDNFGDFLTYRPVKPRTQREEDKPPPIRAWIIYLGNNPMKSMSYPGTVFKKTYRRAGLPDKTMVEVVPFHGTTVYDFTSHDLVGDPIMIRLVPASRGSVDIVGKPALQCEHADHIRWFMQATENGNPAFNVRIHPEDQVLFERYVLKRNVQARPDQELLRETAPPPRDASVVVEGFAQALR